MRTIVFVCIVLVCTQVQAAALRDVTTLHQANVFLKDLFSDAGPNAERLLGPGPNPGGRIIIEAPQLNAIARQFNVAWRSMSNGDRALLEWPGRPLRREEAVEATRGAILAAGAPHDIDIELTGFAPPIVPVDPTPTITLTQLEYNSATGQFSAILGITAEGMNRIDTPISGHIETMAEASVSLKRLPSETVLRPEEVGVARVRTAALQGEGPLLTDQVVGMQLRRAVAAGQPLRASDLIRPALVSRGSTVQIALASSGLMITGQVIALDAGANGEIIRVQNTTSHAFLFAQVVGPGQVRVTPDAPAALTTLPARPERRMDLQ